MPFSHSVATMLGVSALVWVAGRIADRARRGAAVAVAVASHLLLDLAIHDQDLALAPLLAGSRYGTGLYEHMPAAAFLLGIGFGGLCWWAYGGGRRLLAVIVGFNLANVSLFFPSIPGAERWLAGRPTVITAIILAQVLVTLWAVWWAASDMSSGSSASRHLPHAQGSQSGSLLA